MVKDPLRDEMSSQEHTTPIRLPPPDTKRWVPKRKASVVAAVLDGTISLEEACRRYDLSVDEFLSWRNAMEMHGVPGLRTTRLQNYPLFASERGRDNVARRHCRQQIWRF
jgi:transposase-like protein